MSKKRHTIDEIRNDPVLKGQVCSGNNDKQSSNSNAKSSDSFAKDVVETVVDTVSAIISMGTPPKKKS